MIYDWYKIFNKAEFEGTGLVARTYLKILEDRGRVSFYVTSGNTIAITYGGEIYPVDFLEFNKYEKAGCAVYRDENLDVWFGFEQVQ